MLWQLVYVILQQQHRQKLAVSSCYRMTADRQVGEKLYRRGDGTLCYFFSVEDLSSKAEAAGFEAVECKYACTRLLNRKKRFEMRRVFVHGVFRKPLIEVLL